ncbi:hypothetical protein [Mycoplasmopsis cynos]
MDEITLKQSLINRTKE